jgi:hypothetical protein
MRRVRIEISSEHGRHGCQWSVKHDLCKTWTWQGVPSPELWLAGIGSCCESARLALDDQTFRNDLDVQFERIVGTIRHDVTCDLCWPDSSDRKQLAAAAAVNRNAEPGKPPYVTARKRYMDTGRILDKEAMLACVTMEEPDLEKLGSEWEPTAPARPPVINRPRAARALLAATVMLAIASAVLPAVPLLTPLTLLCLMFASLLAGRPKVRR